MKKKKKKKGTSVLPALGGGFIGACALTLVHETVRRMNPDAPRMDVLGMRAIAKMMRKADEQPPNDEKLHDWSMIGDIVSNSLYYSLTGSGKYALVKGAALGLAAGIGGVVLPGPMGLGTAPSSRTPQTKAMTVAWYFLGGLVAAAASRAIARAGKK